MRSALRRDGASPLVRGRRSHRMRGPRGLLDAEDGADREASPLAPPAPRVSYGATVERSEAVEMR
ncbi:hypothetical protein ACFU5O_02540 [Streptomyces sp. NPDC057445]|uniref:hypothetical protein n=1 Tax=Streptomyces sp. NPDC057445 TaxID=3346136 RepID=UPI0036864A5B